MAEERIDALEKKHDTLSLKVDDMEKQLHHGELHFQKIENTLEKQGEALETQTKALGQILKQTQANAHVMFAVKWITIGVGATLLCVKLGFFELLVGIVT